MFDVHPSGYYAWNKQPHSKRAETNQRLTGLIKQFWLESGGVYGYRKIHSDLRDIGEKCGVNRVYRLMHSIGYRKPRHRGGESHIAMPNQITAPIQP